MAEFIPNKPTYHIHGPPLLDYLPTMCAQPSPGFTCMHHVPSHLRYLLNLIRRSCWPDMPSLIYHRKFGDKFGPSGRGTSRRADNVPSFDHGSARGVGPITLEHPRTPPEHRPEQRINGVRTLTFASRIEASCRSADDCLMTHGGEVTKQVDRV